MAIERKPWYATKDGNGNVVTLNEFRTPSTPEVGNDVIGLDAGGTGANNRADALDALTNAQIEIGVQPVSGNTYTQIAGQELIITSSELMQIESGTINLMGNVEISNGTLTVPSEIKFGTDLYLSTDNNGYIALISENANPMTFSIDNLNTGYNLLTATSDGNVFTLFGNSENNLVYTAGQLRSNSQIFTVGQDDDTSFIRFYESTDTSYATQKLVLHGHNGIFLHNNAPDTNYQQDTVMLYSYSGDITECVGINFNTGARIAWTGDLFTSQFQIQTFVQGGTWAVVDNENASHNFLNQRSTSYIVEGDDAGFLGINLPPSAQPDYLIDARVNLDSSAVNLMKLTGAYSSLQVVGNDPMLEIKSTSNDISINTDTLRIREYKVGVNVEDPVKTFEVKTSGVTGSTLFKVHTDATSAFITTAEGGGHLTLTPTGNVAIGTGTPTSLLHVFGNVQTSTAFIAGNIAVNSTGLKSAVSSLMITAAENTTTTGEIIFKTNLAANAAVASEKMRIGSDGKVGIGKTGSLALLDVNGSINGTYLLAGNSVVINGATGAERIYRGSYDVGGIDFTIAASGAGARPLKLYSGSAVKTGGYIPFYIDDVEKMRVHSNGFVGIGTATPGNALDVVGSTKTSTYFQAGSFIFSGSVKKIYHSNVSDGGIDFSTALTTNLALPLKLYSGDATKNDGYIALEQAGVERMRVHTNGKVGINVAAPTSQLHVSGDVTFGSGWLYCSKHYSTTSTEDFIIDAPAAKSIFIKHGNVEKLRVDATGLRVSSDKINVSTAKTPSSATDTGTTGDVCWDADYVYVCISTNVWKRSALTTW